MSAEENKAMVRRDEVFNAGNLEIIDELGASDYIEHYAPPGVPTQGSSAMPSRGETIENPLTGERMTFLQTARDTDGELLRMEYVAPPRSKGPTEHVHPLQEERFEVVSGTLGIRVGGRELILSPGQSAVGPPGVPHTFWNPGEEEVRFVAELRPALNTQEFFETAWGLARDGKATGLGIPKKAYNERTCTLHR